MLVYQSRAVSFVFLHTTRCDLPASFIFFTYPLITDESKCSVEAAVSETSK